MQGTDFCPGWPTRGPQEPRGHSGTFRGCHTGSSLCVASGTFAKRGQTASGLGHLSLPPPPKEFIIFLHQWVCVAFSLPDIPSKLLLLRLTVQVTINRDRCDACAGTPDAVFPSCRFPFRNLLVSTLIMYSYKRA